MPILPPSSESLVPVGTLGRSKLGVIARKLVGLPLQVVRRPLGVQAAWVIAPFFVVQIVRLITNIVLARLLAPEMFGMMLVVNTLRTGTELLSDIGIGQSVVRRKGAPDRAFLDVAWTLQLLRGSLLTLLALVLATPIARLYGHELRSILLVVSSIFLLTGLQSPALFLMQRNMELRQRAAYDVMCTMVQCALTVALAYIMPSVWALVWGLVFSTAFSTVLSFAFGERRFPRIRLDPAHVREIMHFGKWVFVATLIYFGATSTDKAFFGAMLPMTAVGIYSVARTFADMTSQLAQRLGTFIVFPKIAGFRGEHHLSADRVKQTRRYALSIIALGLGVGIAIADAFILLCYDARYHTAAFMLPILLFGVWFAVLANFAEAMLLGCDRPAQAAKGNAVKFAVLAAGLPLALGLGGLFAGLITIGLAEAARWLALTRALVREKLAFLGHDFALTGLLLITAASTKLLLGEFGAVPNFKEWWALGGGLLG